MCQCSGVLDRSSSGAASPQKPWEAPFSEGVVTEMVSSNLGWGSGAPFPSSWLLGFPGILLLQKDSCDNREWIQMVHDSHGSVERSSISQARSINQNGIFTISAPPKFKVEGFQGGLMTLVGSFQLRVFSDSMKSSSDENARLPLNLQLGLQPVPSTIC